MRFVHRLTGRRYGDSYRRIRALISKKMWDVSRDARTKFGMQLASFGGVQQFFRSGFETMKTLIDESRTLYAAIQARCPDGPAERFVISYTSEQVLRDLLAAPSIVATGCTSRERAEELCRGEALRAIGVEDKFRSWKVCCRGIEPRGAAAPSERILHRKLNQPRRPNHRSDRCGTDGRHSRPWRSHDR
jgi:hypothetical protein